MAKSQDPAKVISVLGCGWYGLAAGQALMRANFIVKGSVTTTKGKQRLSDAGLKPYVICLGQAENTVEEEFFECEILMISIPPGFKKGEGHLYTKKITQIVELIKEHDIKNVIYISSTGVYGDSNKELTELDEPGPDNEQGSILLEAENLLRYNPYFNTTIIRFGGLFGPGRPAGRFFSGKLDIPNGKAPVNLIHLADCTGITCNIIEAGYFGVTVNACMPWHPEKQLFYTEAAKKMALPEPVFINELNKWKIINSIRLNNELNYEFRVKDMSGIVA